MGGEEFGVGGEVDGGDGVLGAVAASGGGGAVDGEGAAEQSTGVADVSSGDEMADAAGGDGVAAEDARGVDGDGEAEFAAEGFEAVDAGLGLVAEAEVLAFVDLVDVEQLQRRSVAKSRAVMREKSRGEGQDDDGVDAGGGEEFEFLGEWGDEGLGLARGGGRGRGGGRR